MSTFTINMYLVDEDNNYVRTEDGERIILSTSSVTIDDSYRAIGGNLARRNSHGPWTFDIAKGADEDWYLIVNKNQFCGKYPRQDAAVSVLYGLYTFHDGNQDSFSVWMEESLNTGGSSMDASENNLVLTQDGTDITVKCFDYQKPDGTFIILGWQQFEDGAYDALQPANFVALNGSEVPGSTLTEVFTAAWANLPEGDGARPVLASTEDAVTFTVHATGRLVMKAVPETLTAVSLAPAGPLALQTGNGQVLTATATGTATDIQYNFTVLGDTTYVTSPTNVTSSSSTYQLAWTDTVDAADNIIVVECTVSSNNAGANNINSNTVSIILDHSTSPSLPVIDFAVEVSGTAVAGADVELGDNAYAVITDSSTGGTPSFSYEWYQSVPTLTGITLDNEGT